MDYLTAYIGVEEDLFAEIGAKAFGGSWDACGADRACGAQDREDLSNGWRWRVGLQVLHARAMPVDLD
jgi:hypothetical protein